MLALHKRPRMWKRNHTRHPAVTLPMDTRIPIGQRTALASLCGRNIRNWLEPDHDHAPVEHDHERCSICQNFFTLRNGAVTTAVPTTPAGSCRSHHRQPARIPLLFFFWTASQSVDTTSLKALGELSFSCCDYLYRVRFRGYVP